MPQRSRQNRVTLKDVAAAAHTSTASVSYFLNGRTDKLSRATQTRIRKVIGEMGYIPNAQAQKLQGHPTQVLAVLILNNNNAWAGKFMEGVESVAIPQGYKTVICHTNFNSEIELSYVEKMLSLGVDGFIIHPTSNYKEVHNRITKAGRPVVFFDCALYSSEASWVKSSLYDSIYSAVSSCIEDGFEDFISIGGDVSANRTRMERYAGFQDALKARHLEHKHWTITHRNPTTDELAKKIQLEIRPARRTLLFIHNQWALARVIKAVQSSLQLIPQHLGILSINNPDWIEVTSPAVSSIIEPVEAEGATACELVLEQLSALKHGENIRPYQEILPCSVRWLYSTGTTLMNKEKASQCS